ncbi:MAG: cell wall-active antibiotics response protein [Tannerella sp.]|jgi:predicted membrane protein|nr:cell wall-active antibiotics response protein [Tannerella sp.]
MESTTNKSVFLSVIALALMAGSGLLLSWAINLHGTSIAPGIIMIVILGAVFLYIAGATMMGRIVVRGGEYGKYGGAHNGITFAFLVIGLGILWLCLNNGVVPEMWKPFLISWPMLLFALGCMELCKIRSVSGLILAAIGTYFLVPRFPGTPIDTQFLATSWPVFLVIAGVLIIFSILIKPKRFRWSSYVEKSEWGTGQNDKSTGNQDGMVNYEIIFSGMEQVVLDTVFKGGRVSTVFGGMELDLRRTSLADEGVATLHVETVFGGINIKAPGEWNIEIHSSSVFGGVSDRRIPVQEKDMTRKLVIFAEAVFGGITIVS